MKILVCLIFILSGCTASFQPFPSYSKTEINEMMQKLADNDRILAETIAKLSKGPVAKQK